MKKILKITGIVLLVVFILLLTLPYIFKDRIVEQVKIAMNQNLDATIDFGDFGLSFLRSFPDVSLSINDLSVIGKSAFEGDTLVSAGTIFLTFNLSGIWKGGEYEIKKVRIDDPVVNILVLEDGTTNYDIVPETGTDEKIPDTLAADPADFNIALKKLTLNNAQIVYDDRYYKVYTKLSDFDHTLSGDFSADFTTLQISDTRAGAFSFSYDGIPYLAGVQARLKANIGADLNAWIFTIEDNELFLNDLQISAEGTFAMPEGGYDFDLVFGSPQTQFKSFLSLIPALYTKDFDGLQTSGSMSIGGSVKGIYDEENIPGFDIDFRVENGMFQYPDLPAAVENVNVTTRLFNPGGDADLTVADISTFELEVAGNPVRMGLRLETPVSDPRIDARLNGKIDLARIQDVYPLEDMRLSGIIDSDMIAQGSMSSIENEEYEEFVFTGNLSMSDFEYAGDDIPQNLNISLMELAFTPRQAELNEFSMTMGESDLNASGKIDNILGYALNDEILKGSFETRSAFFDLNPLMETSDTIPVEEEDTVAELSVIEIPANINFTLQSSFDKLLYDKLEMTQMRGAILVAEQKAELRNLKMNMLEGEMTVNGSYFTTDPENPGFDFGLDISGFDLGSTFSTFNTFRKLAPIGENAKGTFSASLAINSSLNEKMEPVMDSLAGSGRFQSDDIRIENSEVMVKIAERLKLERFKTLNMKDVNVNFAFSDGKVEVDPFDMKLGNATARLSGSHSFDQTMDYLMVLSVPRSEFGSAANDLINELAGQAEAATGMNVGLSETVKIQISITGDVGDPSVAVRMGDGETTAREQAESAIEDIIEEKKEEVRDQAQEAIDENREKAQQELERRADQVLEEAQQQAQNMRNEAQKAADAVRQEARRKAEELEEEASNPIARAAARRAGQELIEEADRQANTLEKQADEQADELLQKAEERAEKIKAGEE
ncbi:MAG: AsmA-like C-terminal region-containing protein [Bacteroidales bacterium]